MRKLLLLALILLLAVANAAPKREIKWVLISSIGHKEIVAYIDTNSYRKIEDNGNNIGTGTILYYRAYPVEVDFGTGKKTVTSLAKQFIADCKTGNILPLADYYFNTSGLPTINDQPVGAVDYTKMDVEPVQVSKTNPVYRALCPEYI